MFPQRVKFKHLFRFIYQLFFTSRFVIGTEISFFILILLIKVYTLEAYSISAIIDRISLPKLIATLRQQLTLLPSSVQAQTTPDLTTGLVGYWKFDEGSGTMVRDSSGNKYHGTLVNGPMWVQGKIGKALSFDGVDDYVNIPNLIWPVGGPVTVSFWQKVNSSDVKDSSAFSLGSQNDPNRFQAHTPWSNKQLSWDYGAENGGRVTVDYTDYLDKWTHVVLVSEGKGGTFKAVYLDGVLKASGTSSDGPHAQLQGLHIGEWRSAGYFKGIIDDFRLYNRVLSPLEIQALYEKGGGKLSEAPSSTRSPQQTKVKDEPIKETPSSTPSSTHPAPLQRAPDVTPPLGKYPESADTSSVPAGKNPIDNLKAGEWYMVPNSRLIEVAPDPVPPGSTGVASVIFSWSGGAYDTKRDRLIVWGGGHTNYAGNELYVFDISTLKWQRLTNPATNFGGDETTGYYPDAQGKPDPQQPRSRHTYNYIEYVPVIDRFCSFGGAAFYLTGSTGTRNVDCFDFNTNRWEKRSVAPTNGIGANAVYDPVTKHVWLQGTGYDYFLAEWDPVKNKWTQRTDPDEYMRYDYGKTMTIDTKRHKLVAVGGGEVYVWNLNARGKISRMTLKTTGATEIIAAQAPGLAYDPVSDKIVAWNGGADVYTLDMDTGVWTKYPPAPTNTVIPTAAAKVGTFGRFRYIPSKNAFIVVNDVNQNVYFYKLSNGMGSQLIPSQTSPPSLPTALAKTDSSPLKVPLTVKETAGVGAQGYPVTVVVPLPYGKYFSTAPFRVTDDSGNTVPAQFEVLNRWWGQDNSIRHVMVLFQPTVSAFTGPDTGTATYYLRDDGSGNTVPNPLSITETPSDITIVTGPLKFTVKKVNFTILDQVWFDQNKNGLFEASEQIISSNPRNGGMLIPRSENMTGPQYDSSRNDVVVEVEESGPLRAVIRAEAVTKYKSPTHHTHGWAVRIYAYAGKSYVKIDYQLQNSSKDKVYSWPLYFKAMNINFKLNLTSTHPKVRFGEGDGIVYQQPNSGGIYLAQEMHHSFKIYEVSTKSVLFSGKIPDGFIDVSDDTQGITAVIRNFWQMWPNGLKIDDSNTLSLQLFPEWSAQWYQNRISPTGLYWLEDMQHVYKETLLYFHGTNTSDTDLINLAKTFQYHPVVTLPTSWYEQTGVTLDLGGMIPIKSRVAGPDQRQPRFDPRWFDSSGNGYRFNWVNFAGDDRPHSCDTGGWPTSVSFYIATENPRDYFEAENRALNEINLRNQWIAQYKHDRDWPLLQLTENPYCSEKWRKLIDPGIPLDAPYLPGTGGPVWGARDDQHGWFYHAEEAYEFTGNPWIKDWYKFIAEFRRVRLDRLDPFPDKTSRATGHALNHALQVYRITGDISILTRFRDHIQKYLRPEQSPLYGGNMAGYGGPDAAFQVGYLSRAIINFMEEIKEKDWQAYAEAFNYLSGLMEWNLNYANFAYSINVPAGEIGASSGTASPLADPQAWYYWHTGKKAYLDQLNQYVNEGIHGGAKPYGDLTRWTSDAFLGRWTQFVRQNPRPDTTPPSQITDLKATLSGSQVVLSWTAPKDPDLHHYHIVWSTKPISATQTTDTTQSNWWAANAIGPSFKPEPGRRQSITITPSTPSPFYAAIFTFDNQGNMSPMSNVAQAQVETTSSYQTSPPSLPSNSDPPSGDTPSSVTSTPSLTARKVIKVGPTRTYTKPSQAAAAAKNGNIIEIDAGTYLGDVAVWSADNLIIRGVGGRPHLNANGASAQGKGIWVITGKNTTIENIEFSGATASDQNGAAIRQEGAGLIIRNCYFHDNEEGILTNSNPKSDIIIENSEFANNGFGDGRTHNIYIGNIRSFTLRYSYSHHAKIGHNVKSRAQANYILYNRIMDEWDGTASYAIDLPNGGVSYIIGNLIQQGPNNDNSGIIAYAAEGASNPIQELYIINNTIVNDDPQGGTFVLVYGNPTISRLINNIFAGPGTLLTGKGILIANLSQQDPKFVNRLNFDYHLAPGSPAIDAGVNPGMINGFDLTPKWEYVHPTNKVARTILGKAIDIGAYEYPVSSP